MRALVTGANGLLGGHLLRALLRDGHTARALVRAGSNQQTLVGLEVERVQGDVRDAAALGAAVDGCEVVYHAAAVFSYWGHDRHEMHETARAGTYNIVRACKDAGVRRLVLTSSTAVLGGSPTAAPLDESAQLRGNDHPDYFVTKVLQETTAVAAAAQLGVELVIVNPAIFIGPHDFRPSAALAMVTSYLADPLKLTFAGGCNVVHAADVAQAHLVVAARGTPGERYIVGADNLLWRDVHALISQLAGTYGPGPTVGRTAAVLAAATMEAAAKFIDFTPPATRALARRVGDFYWYRSDKLAALGFTARPTRVALHETLRWLADAATSHISPAQRERLRRSPALFGDRF